MEVSFNATELILPPKSLLINLLPPCFIVAVVVFPEIEADLEREAPAELSSLVSLIPTGGITPNILPALPVVHLQKSVIKGIGMGQASGSRSCAEEELDVRIVTHELVFTHSLGLLPPLKARI